MNLLSLTLSSKVSRERGGRSGEGNYPRWLERLLVVLGTLGRPRPAPTTGKEGLEPPEGGRGCLPRNFPFLVAGARVSAGRCHCMASRRAMERGRQGASGRAPSENEGLHPSEQHREEAAQQLQHTRRAEGRGEEPAGDGGRRTERVAVRRRSSRYLRRGERETSRQSCKKSETGHVPPTTRGGAGVIARHRGLGRLGHRENAAAAAASRMQSAGSLASIAEAVHGSETRCSAGGSGL